MSEVTQNDVKLLYGDATPGRRSVLAQKLARDLKRGELSETETDLAIAICHKLAEDVDESVRQSLAEALKHSQDIPKELALQLAQDVTCVSLPMLEFNALLEEEDLIAIVKNGETQRQLAISHRAHIPEMLTWNLCAYGTEEVVDSTLQNAGADFEEDTYHLVLDRFQQCEAVHASMAARQDLSHDVVDRMIGLVSEQLKTFLVKSQNLSALQVERLILESREDARRRLMTHPQSRRHAEKLVHALHSKGKLNNELIFRALEIGDRDFFEAGMAKLVDIPVESARKLIRDPGEKGFAALYKRARLPQNDFAAVVYMVEVEYHSKRRSPITAASGHADEPESWLTETADKKGKWHLF